MKVGHSLRSIDQSFLSWTFGLVSYMVAVAVFWAEGSDRPRAGFYVVGWLTAVSILCNSWYRIVRMGNIGWGKGSNSSNILPYSAAYLSFGIRCFPSLMTLKGNVYDNFYRFG